uniref:CS domain-containing protein n=1 Tax=Trypanosoma congolense (strain IL3000) TaxID=1068625 RepID=G0UUT9_TRYCI|nr:conserved hypothetical protein [Trypanosoma congolense IL3000]
MGSVRSGMPGIDYSKWDKICCSDDSESELPEKPTVTHLQYPSRVTIGNNGVHVETSAPEAAATPFGGAGSTSNKTPPVDCSSAQSVLNDKAGSAVAALSSHCCHSNDAGRDSDGVGDEDDDILYKSLTHNGGREEDSHIWSQTRDTATVGFILPSMSIRAKDVHSFRIEAEEQSNRTSMNVISFGIRGIEVKYRHVLRYPVKLDEDILDGCWALHSLKKHSLRILVVQLVKETMAIGVTLWWDRCFVSDRTIIDTTKISDRNDGSATRAQTFRESWQEAHEEFKRRMAERRNAPRIIDDDDLEDNADGG